MRRINNKGVALISVMVVLTVALLLASLVLEITYNSLLARKVNSKAADNFYSSETVVDGVETVLQSIAIQSAIDLGSLDDTAEFVNVVEDRLKKASGAATLNDYSTLSQYFYNELKPEIKQILGKADEGGSTYVYDDKKFKISAVKKTTKNGTQKGTLTITVYLKYQDESGYLNEITTDLVINDVTSRTPASQINIANYTMFTGGGAYFYGERRPGDNNSSNGWSYASFIQEGCAYVGGGNYGEPALEVTKTGIVFEGSRVIINGDVRLSGGAALVLRGGEGDTKCQVDIRGTLYIDGSSSLVVGDGVDLLVNDIKLSSSGLSYDVNGKKYTLYKVNKENGKSNLDYADNGDYPGTSDISYEKYPDQGFTSVFDTGSKQYAYAGKKVFDSDNFPYVSDFATMKANATIDSSTNTFAEYGNRFGWNIGNLSGNSRECTSGCIVYCDKTSKKSYVCKLVYDSDSKSYKLNTLESQNNETGSEGKYNVDGVSFSKDSTFGPLAKTTFYAYDGNSYSVDGEMTNFVNLDVLYMQSKFAQGGAGIDMSKPKSLKNKGTLKTQDSILKFPYVVNDYEIKKISYIDNYTSSDYANNYNSLPSPANPTNITFKGNNISGYDFLFGDVQSAIHNSTSNVLWANQWAALPVYTPNGSYLGTVISAERAKYQKNGAGASIAYALVNMDSTDLKKLVDEMKYVCLTKDAILNKNGNGRTYYETAGLDFDKMYSFGMIDSLYAGGLESFLNTDSSGTGSGEVKFNINGMYDFITVENWKNYNAVSTPTPAPAAG